MNAVGDKRRASSEDSAYYFCQSKNSVDPKTDPGYATRFGNRIPAIIATVTAIVTEIIGVGHYKELMSGYFQRCQLFGVFTRSRFAVDYGQTPRLHCNIREFAKLSIPSDYINTSASRNFERENVGARVKWN